MRNIVTKGILKSMNFLSKVDQCQSGATALHTNYNWPLGSLILPILSRVGWGRGSIVGFHFYGIFIFWGQQHLKRKYLGFSFCQQTMVKLVLFTIQ